MSQRISGITRQKMSASAKRRCTAAWRHAKSLAYRATVDEKQLVALYRMGLSQHEVATLLGTTQKVVWRRLKLLNIQARPAIKRNQFGVANDSWRGNKAGYAALHARVKALWGKPSECDKCGTKTAKRYEWANRTGNYLDPADYDRLCVKCHRRFDVARRAAQGGVRTSPQP